jgi:hypothetical protein
MEHKSLRFLVSSEMAMDNRLSAINNSRVCDLAAKNNVERSLQT